MSADPQQELFSALLVTIKEQGYDVYDGAMPSVNTPYPFVYLADSQQIDDENKSAIFGTCIKQYTFGIIARQNAELYRQ